METEKNVSSQLAERVQKVFAEIGRMVAEVMSAAWEWIKSNLQSIRAYAIRLQKKNERRKHNQHTRSTWVQNWDSRKRHQVVNRKPNFAVARRNC